MYHAGRSRGGWAVLVALVLATPALLADNEQLQQAKDLYAQEQYQAAQEQLLQINPDELSDEQGQEYAALLEQVREAIQAVARAEQDAATAEQAYEQGHWDEAERLYHAVADNEFAPGDLREAAAVQLQRITEKKQLAEAARPSGPTGEAPAEAPAEPTPEEPQASQQAEPRAAAPPPSAERGAQPRRLTVIDEMRQTDRLLWQRAQAKLLEAAEKIEAAIAESRFDEARRLAEQAIQTVEASRPYAYPPEEYETARQQALGLRERVRRAFEEYSIEQARRKQQEIAEQIAERRERQEQLRQEKVEQLFNTARQLEKERRFQEAAEAVRQLLAIDPANDRARLALDIYEELASLGEQRAIQEDVARARRQTFTETERALIPWPNDVLYPKNWLEISARRDRARQGGVSDEDFELNRKLEELQPEISLVEQPFDQVVDYMTDLNQVNIAVDWEDLRLAGIERDKPITIRLRNVSLGTVLGEVLNQVSGEVPLGFSVGDGLLRIATRQKLDREKFILVYDIRDLLVRIEDFINGPRIDLTRTGGSESSSASADLFTHGPDGASDDESENGLDQAQVTKILDIIRTQVEPDSWRETAGGDGALRELNGQLIVYNTSDAHRQIRDLLGQLREQRALMIAVEARFLTVTSNFLEEIGVDIDFVFNAGEAGFDPAFNTQGQQLFDPFTGSAVLIPRQFSRIGTTPTSPGFGTPLTTVTPQQPFFQPGFVPAPGGVIPNFSETTPIPVQQQSINLVDPQQLNTGIPGSISQTANFGPALTLAGSFLDNLQVDFLIRATQANKRSSIVQAPRLMLFNGQRAWVAVTRDRQFVSSVTPQVAEGAVGVQPQPQGISSGSTLDVEGTISADRKYVTLTVRIGFAEEPNFERFEVQRASGNSPGIFVTLPDQKRQAINTTVSVPDGGTVLIGGLKSVGEIEMDAGVPILSKIPILKRAFTNSTTIKDTQTLLILLKAKILIQQEAEEEAFPTLTRGA